MKSMLLVGMVLGLGLTSLAAETPTPISLSGSFCRSGQKSQPQELKATLTPDGAGQWKVVYDFTWKDKPQQYKGTIKGDLQDGDVSGDASTRDGKRTWEIKGTAKNGELTFDHWETTGGGRKPTGNATLK